jgi:hypothetical protein
MLTPAAIRASFMNDDALAQCLAELEKPTVEVHYGNVFAKGKTSKVIGFCFQFRIILFY